MVPCLVVGVLPVKAGAVTADSFTDVSKDSWYYDYVDYVAKKGYFAGTTKTTFSPNKGMTRAMFVVVLARHDGVTVDNSKSSFSDVAAGAWCAGAVNWAAENGIVLGYPDGTFKPNESITRAQMCAIMDNYVNYYTAKHKVTAEKKGTSTVLADQNEIPAYAKTAVKNCQTYGLITGYGDGTFRPQTTSTRAQVAAVIYRLSFLTESAQPSSGGGGGGGGVGDSTPGSTPTSDTYAVEVKFSIPNDRSLTLIADYTVTTAAGNTSGNKTVNDLAMELVSSPQNANKLKNAIQIMLDNVEGKSDTATVNGQTVTVNVSDDGNFVISAKTTVPVASIVNSGSASGASLLTAEVTPEQIEDLMAKLEAGGTQDLTATNVEALDKVLDKLNGMDGNDILEYVQNSGNAAMQQAAIGLTAGNIDAAIVIYKSKLEQIQSNVNPSGGEVNIGSPVTMTVDVNLQSYLNRANTLHQNNENRAIQKLAEKLGVSDRLSNPAVSAAVHAIYNWSKPGDFVATDGSDTDLKLKSVDDYYGKLVSYVNAMCNLRTAVGETSTFYATQLGRAQDFANGHPSLLRGTDLTSPVLANLMGTTGTITNTTTGTILNVDVHVKNESYSDMSTLLQSNLTSLGYSSIAAQIPGSVPSNLTRFFGDYNLTVKINESSN